MAFTGQVFSVGQVLTAAQMNQQDENIDEVRRDHKGTTAPPELTAGVSWLDDSNPEWMLKQFDGVDQIAKGWFDTSQNQFTASVMGQFKNKLINGNMGLAQRGNSAQITNIGAYGLDRWLAITGNGGQLTVTQESFTLGQTEVPNEPEFFQRIVQNSGGSSGEVGLLQNIEDVRTFAGQQITLSFYARSNSGALTITPNANQNFGSGGGASGSVVHLVNSISVTGSFQKFTQTFSITNLSGKTIGTNNNDNLRIFFVAPFNTTYSLDIAQVQVERGPIATPFEMRHIGQEKSLAQRYYEKTMNLNTPPKDAVPGGNGGIFVIVPSSTYAATAHWHFTTPKRAIPSIQFFTHATSGGGAWRNVDNNAFGPPAIANFIGVFGTGIQGINSWQILQSHIVHATADAEL